MNNYKISIITPVYNTPSWMLNKCFMSVINQTYSDWELIIVDDGSTSEDTNAAIRDFCNKYSKKNIRLIINSHVGIAESENIGLKNTTGDFLIFLDSDDYIESNYLEELINCQQKDNYDVVICGVKVIDYYGKSVLRTEPSNEVLKDVVESMYYTPSMACKLYKLDYIKKYNILCPPNCINLDDIFSSFAIAGANNIASIEYYGYCVRSRDDSACRNRKKAYSTKYQQIPFMSFNDVLIGNVYCASEIQREKLFHRMIKAMMYCSFLFTCYSDFENRYRVTKKLAYILRKRYIGRWKDAYNLIHHSNGFIERICLTLYINCVIFHTEVLFSEVFSLISRVSNCWSKKV